MIPKVFIAAPINKRKEYCTERYFATLINLSYTNREFYFVDNSKDGLWHTENVVKKWGLNCDHVSPEGKRNNDYITESQNLIRKKFLESDCTHLMFIEQDIFPSGDIVEKLLAYNHPVAVARYFIGQDKSTIRLMGMEIEEGFGRNTNRSINYPEDFIEYGRKTKAKMFGFGCVLFERKIMERTNFFIDPNHHDHSDSYFYLWLNDEGIQVAVHEEICEHQNSSWQKVNDYLPSKNQIQ